MSLWSAIHWLKEVSPVAGPSVSARPSAIAELSAAPVVLLIGKGGKHRVVPVGRYAARALEAYLVRARPGLAQRAASRRAPGRGASRDVFLNARGGRLTRQGA